jgi:membrane fusion protein (multidrug efflux system)
MKRIAWIALLLCTACSGGSTDEVSPVPSALVTLARAERGVLVQRVTLYGSAEDSAGGKVVLIAPAEALVARIVAPVGTGVARGDVVAELSPAPNTRLDIAKASADARAADAAYARARRLRDDGLVGDAEVETARAAAAGTDATRASLAGRAGALTLRAIAPGFVESVAVSPGDLVPAGAAVATITRSGDLRGRFGADPAIARTLHPGTPIRIEATAGRAAFEVPIQSVTPVVDPTTKLAAIFVLLPASGGIGAGEALTATVAASAVNEALTIPYAALLDDGGQPYVFVVVGNVAHRRNVAVGAAEGDRVAITGGVHAGEPVIIQGGTAVEDGMKVRTR